MPREKESLKLIPKIYKRNYEDISMFFYVLALRKTISAMSIQKCLYMYFGEVGIDDYNIESAMTTFTRMQKEYIELKRNETSKKIK